MSRHHRGTLTDHVSAHTEEQELEALVSVLGDERAQDAADAHDLPALVDGLASDSMRTGRPAGGIIKCLLCGKVFWKSRGHDCEVQDAP